MKRMEERETESNRKALADSDRDRGARTRGRCEVGDRVDGSSEFHESFTAEEKWDFEGSREKRLSRVSKGNK